MLRLDNARLQNNFFSQAQSQSSSVFVSSLNPYIYNNNGAQLENWNEYSEQEQQPMRQPVQQTVQRPMQFSPPKPMPSADVQQSPIREESQHREQKSFSTPANFEDLKSGREEKARGPAFSTPDAHQPKKPIVIVKPTQKSRSDDKRSEERGDRNERHSRHDRGKRSRDEDSDEEQRRKRRNNDSRRTHSRDDADINTKFQALQAQLDALKSSKPKDDKPKEQPEAPTQIIRKCMHWGKTQ